MQIRFTQMIALIQEMLYYNLIAPKFLDKYIYNIGFSPDLAKVNKNISNTIILFRSEALCLESQSLFHLSEI